MYNPLIEKDGEWYMDFEDLEKKVKDPDNKMMILCNPHNPIGRAWTKEELEKVGNLCADHGVFLISDEIHADFMMNGKEHQPVSTISETVSYTHLDVYKRQLFGFLCNWLGHYVMLGTYPFVAAYFEESAWNQGDVYKRQR